MVVAGASPCDLKLHARAFWIRRSRSAPCAAAAAAAPCAPMPLSCSARCCLLRHRAGSLEPTRRPRERRRAASESSILIAPSALPSVRRSQSAPCAAAAAAAPCAPMPLSCSARCCPLRHRAGSPRADTTTARAPPSRERVVDPDRAVGFVERASIPIRALRGGSRARRAPFWPVITVFVCFRPPHTKRAEAKPRP